MSNEHWQPHKHDQEKGLCTFESPRDTQFLGFAKLLLAQVIFAADGVVISDSPHWSEEQLIIAQRAYDLVAHTIDYMHPGNWDWGGIAGPESAAEIPDMTEWPKYEKTIIINGYPVKTYECELTYEQVSSLVPYSATITITRGGVNTIVYGHGTEWGLLKPGQSVAVQDDMIFTVVVTDNA